VLFGHLKSCFTNKAASCKFSRCGMALFIGFAWSIGGSIGVGASAFESKSIYSSNLNRVPEYFFSIFDTSKAITCMGTEPPNMAVVCVPSTSVPNSQNALLISAKPSLSTQSTILPSKTSFEEATVSRILKISPEPKISRKYSIEKQNYLFFITE